ncbi:MAG: hypothetical protein PHP13_02125 [Methanomicrobium sp.]|nr:hypothetical protein [Methanomicrobium sp.]
MKLQRTILTGLFGLILISIIACPASAESDETTIAGVVSKVMPSDGTIEIRAERFWNGATWTGISVTFVTQEYITGSVPDSSLYKRIYPGDPVQATFAGDEEDMVSWLCIGKVQSGGSTGKYLSDAYGDPKYIISPFFNNFKLKYEPVADCTKCSGALCDAPYSDLRASQGFEEKNYANDYRIKTGERHVFSSPEGCESEFAVTYIKGQASLGACSSYPASDDGMPETVFEMNVVVKGTVADMTPKETVIPTATSKPPTPQTTHSSPGFFFAAAAAGIIAAILKREIKK